MISFPKQTLWMAFGLWLFLSGAAVRADDTDNHPLKDDHVQHDLFEVIPDAKATPYTPILAGLMKKWPPSKVPPIEKEANPIWMRAIATPGDDDFFGVLKRIRIRAPWTKVTAALDDFDHYKMLYPDLRDIKVVGRSGNELRVEWDRSAPVFFMPNVHYTNVYITKVEPTRKIYRYQLIDGNYVHSSDGLVVVEKVNDNLTSITAWDFFNASFGLVRALAGGTIWRRTLEGSYKADAALKFRCEHPDWSADKLEDESGKLLDKYPFDKIRFLKPILTEPIAKEDNDGDGHQEKKPPIELRLAYDKPAEADLKMEAKATGETLYVEPKALLTSALFSNCDLTVGKDKDWVLSVVLTDAGKSKLAKITGDNIGKRLGILVNGVLWNAPVIKQTINSESLTISFQKMNEKEAKNLASQLAATCPPPHRK